MKLIKFDTIYPAGFLDKKISESHDKIKNMSYNEYHEWVISLRMNFSDFYTYNLVLNGWSAKDFFLNNDLYLKKCSLHYFGLSYYYIKLYHRFRNMFSVISVPFAERLIKRIILVEKPDVIFIREQVFIRSKFWEQFRKNALVVSRMDCDLPQNWSPLSFDLIYTNMTSFKHFFSDCNIKTLSNSNGFDQRILSEIKYKEKSYDVTFVGGLGSYYGFVERTRFFEKLLNNADSKFQFSWWGYKTENFERDYPELSKKYMGAAGGIDLFTIYAQSKIVLNCFDSNAGGIAINQRMFEVLGMGTLLLALESESLVGWENYLVTYKDVDDCVEKIKYYLAHEDELEKIAKAGQAFVLENYSYLKLMGKLSEELTEAYNKKFGK